MAQAGLRLTSMGKPKCNDKRLKWGGRKAGLSFDSALTGHSDPWHNDPLIKCSVMAGTPVFPTIHTFNKHLLSIYYVPGTENTTKHVTWAEHKVLRVEVSGVQDTKEGTGAGEEA